MADKRTMVANCIGYVRSTIRSDKAKLELEISRDESDGKTRDNSLEFDLKCEKQEHLAELEKVYTELLDSFLKGEIK